MRVHRLSTLLQRAAQVACLFTAVACLAATAWAQQDYQKPPQEILNVLNAPVTPQASVSPSRDVVLLFTPVPYPPIADLAQPMLRLAGLRINPATNGPHNAPRHTNLVVKRVADGGERRIGLAADFYFSPPVWAPDGRHFAFTHATRGAVELWIGDAQTGNATAMPGVALNSVLGTPCEWMPDSRSLLCRSVPGGRGRPPERPAVPTGPRIEESFGKAAPVPTYEDLLESAYDEALFDYYAASQLVVVDSASGNSSSVGQPAIFGSVEPAPGGQHLLVARIHQPYSYLVPAFAFPGEVEVWDRTGLLVYKVASLPLEENVPIGGVPTGPRNVHWIPTDPAELAWVEALDDGNPKKKVPQRDKVMWLRAPFTAAPAELARTEQRFAGLAWGEKGDFAILRDFDRDKLRGRAWFFNPGNPAEASRLVWDLSTMDRYHNPGAPVTRTLPSGHSAVLQDGDFIYLTGTGASPEGDRPFLDRFDTKALKAERVFRCDEKSYESVVALLSGNAASFLTRRESPTEPPNYFIHAAGGAARQFTSFPDPVPQLRSIKKQLVTYKRADGVGLSFTLYLPPDYKVGERRPGVVWAYPLEFTDPGVAGQVSGSPNRFTTIAGPSHLFFLLEGYVVLDGASMPVVGDPETVNNTYVEQITASAKAAIDKAVEMGVLDPNRVGVGGHSYGAFMTANLLAHTDLFRAGIARSGAYNRTLTPFGFQSERRTLWEALEMYVKVSPFMHANKIKVPILLIHGEADNNSGTFPIQSERLYRAIKGNGGSVRYVTLPHEAHGYAGRESIEHVLWEMITWFDKFVKNAPPRPAVASSTENVKTQP